MAWINRLYIIFLAIILTLTTGFGVAAFFPQPTRPEAPIYPSSPVIPQSCYATPESKNSPDCQQYFNQQTQSTNDYSAQNQKYQQELIDYQNRNSGYTRTAIFLGVVIGAIFIMVGVTLIKKSKIIANGILFAGVLTAILTRLLITVASLGQTVAGTDSANSISYLEFGILTILSIAVIVVGLTSLKEEVHI